MTTELIKTTGITLNGDKITAVNARDLWKFLESKQEFANWIKDRVEKYRFVEGKDFLINFSKSLGRPSKEYFISLDMAKELAMVENNEHGRQARQYFIEVEKRFRHAGNLVEAIRAALTPIIRENEQYNGRDISLLMENPTLPGLFEEIPVNLMNGHFGALPEPEA